MNTLLIPEIDLLCMGEEYEDHLNSWLYEEGPENEKEWMEMAIVANPGMWISRLCRNLHDLPENETSVMYCGRCSEYANKGKKKRAKQAELTPTLPGMEDCLYRLHDPCTKWGLTAVRHYIYRRERKGLVVRKREKIPDTRQPRGWDWGSRVYPLGFLLQEMLGDPVLLSTVNDLARRKSSHHDADQYGHP